MFNRSPSICLSSGIKYSRGPQFGVLGDMTTYALIEEGSSRARARCVSVSELHQREGSIFHAPFSNPHPRTICGFYALREQRCIDNSFWCLQLCQPHRPMHPQCGNDWRTLPWNWNQWCCCHWCGGRAAARAKVLVVVAVLPRSQRVCRNNHHDVDHCTWVFYCAP